LDEEHTPNTYNYSMAIVAASQLQFLALFGLVSITDTQECRGTYTSASSGAADLADTTRDCSDRSSQSSSSSSGRAVGWLYTVTGTVRLPIGRNTGPSAVLSQPGLALVALCKSAMQSTVRDGLHPVCAELALSHCCDCLLLLMMALAVVVTRTLSF
jgi:hypothetical protein